MMQLAPVIRSRFARYAGLLCLFGILLNEVRGVLLAVPVLYAMYQSGGTGMALWLGFCSLAGIALSVLVPWYLGRRLVMRFS